MGKSPIFRGADRQGQALQSAGKTLSESLRILGNFRLNGHIDPDLFDVFVRRKIYLRYAGDSSTRPDRRGRRKQDTGIRSLIGRRPCALSSTVA